MKIFHFIPCPWKSFFLLTFCRGGGGGRCPTANAGPYPFLNQGQPIKPQSFTSNQADRHPAQLAFRRLRIQYQVRPGRHAFSSATCTLFSRRRAVAQSNISSVHRDCIQPDTPFDSSNKTPEMAGERSSSEADRKLEAGTVNSTEPGSGSSSTSNSSTGGGLHPAFYIALWIFLSSSIILFNKWILTTAKFGKIKKN